MKRGWHQLEKKMHVNQILLRCHKTLLQNGYQHLFYMKPPLKLSVTTLWELSSSLNGFAEAINIRLGAFIYPATSLWNGYAHVNSYKLSANTLHTANTSTRYICISVVYKSSDRGHVAEVAFS